MPICSNRTKTRRHRARSAAKTPGEQPHPQPTCGPRGCWPCTASPGRRNPRRRRLAGRRVRLPPRESDVCVSALCAFDVQVAARAGTDELVAAQRTIGHAQPDHANDHAAIRYWRATSAVAGVIGRSKLAAPLSQCPSPPPGSAARCLLSSRAEVSPFNAEDIDPSPSWPAKLASVRKHPPVRRNRPARHATVLTEVAGDHSSAARKWCRWCWAGGQGFPTAHPVAAQTTLRSAHAAENDAEQLGLLVNIEDSRLFQKSKPQDYCSARVCAATSASGGVISRTLSWLVLLTSKATCWACWRWRKSPIRLNTPSWQWPLPTRRRSHWITRAFRRAPAGHGQRTVATAGPAQPRFLGTKHHPRHRPQIAAWK